MGVNQMVRNTVTGEIAYFVCHNDEMSATPSESMAVMLFGKSRIRSLRNAV